MIELDSLRVIGLVTKTHGYKGEVMVKLDFSKDIFGAHPVTPFFIKIDGIPVPFFAESIRGNSRDKAYFKFEDIDSEREASVICGEEVFVETERLAEMLGVEVEELENDDDDIIGYSVIDLSTGSKIGRVEDIIEGIEYDYLQVIDEEGDEILIPLVEDYIVRIEENEVLEDEDPGVIYMKLPEGFLSIKH